ncbi:MAG: cobalt-precorrin-6A reductase [Pseudomonadota bacterium]
MLDGSARAADPRPRVLILGGTRQARELAQCLRAEADGQLRVQVSLAGVTTQPAQGAPDDITGGFGGAEGLANFLRQEHITLLVDATHPFAAIMSASAVHASAAAGVPLLCLERPAWTPPQGARCTDVTDLSQAAAALPKGARALLTVGARSFLPFISRTDCRFVARMIEPPATTLPAGWTVVQARPPFLLADERALLHAQRISHLVTKNSGGDDVAAKLQACVDLSVEIIMVARPERSAGHVMRAHSVAQAAEQVLSLLGIDGSPRAPTISHTDL